MEVRVDFGGPAQAAPAGPNLQVNGGRGSPYLSIAIWAKKRARIAKFFCLKNVGSWSRLGADSGIEVVVVAAEEVLERVAGIVGSHIAELAAIVDLVVADA